MLERTQIRLLPLANRAAEHAPMVTACCNACRTCAQTNVIGLALAALAAVGGVVARLAKRSPDAT